MLETPCILWYDGHMTVAFRDNPIGAGNQQERSFVSPEFLAGLIVGEGSYCIAIARSKKGYIALNPMFSLRMNDIATVDKACEAFSHYGLGVYRNPAVYHRCASISVTGSKRLRPHLDFFLPLLTGKKLEAALIVSEFVDRRLGPKRNLSYTEEDVGLVERLRAVNGPSGPRLPIEILRDYTLRPSPRKRLKRLAG